MNRILITGGAGFIGSNLVRLALTETDYEVVNLDLLTYAGNLASLRDVERHPRYRFVRGDVADPEAVRDAVQGCDGVLHLAAESHVDRSIEDPGPFLKTNVLGTRVMLDAARKANVQKFVQVSTDEVYGDLAPEDPAFTEETRIECSSPYSASKAAADLLARAYHRTYGLPVIITRCSNNYGPYQFPEKLIPLAIRNLMNDQPVPVYGDGLQIRDWLFVEDHCRALLTVLQDGAPGQVYNIGGDNETRNLDLVKLIIRTLGKSESLIHYVKDRPGHDRRYAINSSKIQRELRWKPRFRFPEAIALTIQWYQRSEDWVASVTSGEYLEYYERQYGQR